MRMGQARDTACRWVEEEASSLPGFRGAYFSGSITALADDAPLPVASDVDVKLVMVGADVSASPQKFVYRGVVLDVSSQSIEDIWPPETALASYFSAAHFTHPCIISDP